MKANILRPDNPPFWVVSVGDFFILIHGGMDKNFACWHTSYLRLA